MLLNLQKKSWASGLTLRYVVGWCGRCGLAYFARARCAHVTFLGSTFISAHIAQLLSLNLLLCCCSHAAQELHRPQWPECDVHEGD